MAANLQNITSITHGMSGQALTTSSFEPVLPGGFDPNITYKINSIIVSNIDGTNDVDVTVRWDGSFTSAHLARTVTVPADSTLVVTTQDNPIYLSASCGIYAYASANGDAEILFSYEIITSSNGTTGTM